MFKNLKVGDLVKTNSNCENTRKPIYKIYAILKTKKGKRYIIENTYISRLHSHLFEKRELTKI